jgi:Regulator of chromosome condensation (RCC1) repeat
MESTSVQTQAGGNARLVKGRRALKLVASAGGLVLLLFILWGVQQNPFGFCVGRPLPPGRVAPQLWRADDVAVLLAPDGGLWCWGLTEFPKTVLVEAPTVWPQRIGADDDWCQVAASSSHALALKTNGTLWGWGSTNRIGLTSAQLKGKERKVTTPTRIGTDSDWTHIAVCGTHSVALKRDGSLWGWGQNDRGQVGDGGTRDQFTVTQIGHDRDWSAIAAGAFSSFALKQDGTLWGWGYLKKETNDVLPRPIGLGSNIVAMAANDLILLALRSDHTLWICGPNSPVAAYAYVKTATATLTQIGTDRDWQEVHAGKAFFMARKANGSWWVCGNYQRHDDPMWVGAPRRLPLSFEAWSLAPGLGDACLLTRDGAVWTLTIHPQRGKFAVTLKKTKELANQLLRRLPAHPQPFNPLEFPIDPTPRKQWQWPVDNSQLLRLRAQAEAAIDQISCLTPRLPRAAWSEHGTDKPLNTVLTMFWALRQGDQGKLENMVSRVRDSQTLDDLIYPRSEWGKITAIRVVSAGITTTVSRGRADVLGNAEVIIEKAPGPDGANKEVSKESWSFRKVNNQWLIIGRW